ncbi:MAG: AAA family ATPase, partial [Paludibacteraceae bacterium]|nr:AAA family ATPase [Paludibacteraceae bacterium]
IAYEYEPQAFLKAYVRAYETNEPVFLVIEEINRGNCAQIFGDMFQLLDRNENGESDYAIKPETAIQEFLNEKLKDCNIEDEAIKSGEEMRLPANLHIWATMNTSDQSLFPIDSAFKRRWDWKYMPINTQKESWSIKVNGTEYSWSNFLEKINAEIDVVTHSEDKKLGFYFCKAENGVISAERFVSKVLFYIWNDVFKDYGFEKDIFNDTEGKLSFGKFYQENGEIRKDKVALFLKNLGVDEHTSTSENPGDAEEGNAENN